MNNIKILRTEKNLSQEELAKQIHVTQTMISQLEKGKKQPSREVAESLADFFEVTLDYLLGRTAERNNSYFANNISGSNLVQGSGSVSISDIETTTKEEAELLRIFRALDVRERARLLNTAFALEDKKEPICQGHS